MSMLTAKYIRVYLAACLAASGTVALVKKMNKLDGCSVAVDGSLYKKHP